MPASVVKRATEAIGRCGGEPVQITRARQSGEGPGWVCWAGPALGLGPPSVGVGLGAAPLLTGGLCWWGWGNKEVHMSTEVLLTRVGGGWGIRPTVGPFRPRPPTPAPIRNRGSRLGPIYPYS